MSAPNLYDISILHNDAQVSVASIQDNGQTFHRMISFDPNGNTSCSCETRWSSKRILLPLVAGGAAVAAAPLVLGAVGFSSVGIAGASIAAKMMSAAAIAKGGGVAAGGTVALLQSAGAAGIGAAGNAAIAGVAGGTTAAGHYVYEKVTAKK